MPLYTQTLNPDSSLPDLFMVHGWAMHSALWSDFASLLSDHWRVTLVDLPGHGDSADQVLPAKTLDDWAAALLDVAPEKAVWLGWSLGGLLAQWAAIIAPERVAALALVSSTPCFTRREDWSHAVDAIVFRQFAQNLSTRFDSTITRFLSLQIQGSEQATTTLKHLRERLHQKSPATPRALNDGLVLLLDSDLREDWARIRCPLLAFYGEKDTLVPVNTACSVLRLSGYVRSQVLDKEGHALFITQGKVLAEAIRELR